MHGHLERELNPRDALPLTDEEICELYRRSQAREEFATPRERALHSEEVQRWSQIETGSYVLLAAIGAAVAVLSNAIDQGAVALFCSFLTAACVYAVVLAVRGRIVIGPMSWAALRLQLAKARNEEVIAAYDGKILVAVVEYLTREPIEQAERLRAAVADSRAAIAHSLEELPKITRALGEEITASRDEAMTLLLRSKRAAAERCIQRLGELDAELRAQAEGALEAVRPVRELSERFERIRRLSESLASIQAAHGLIERSEQAVEDGRVQLQIVRAASSGALCRLREIERIVDAHERARAEVGV